MSPRKISRIKVCNVKGHSEWEKVFAFPNELIANKYHIFVAQNGFGKSSIATAFDYFKPQSMRIPEELTHKEASPNSCSLEIDYEANASTSTLIADYNSNSISSTFDTFVINSKLSSGSKRINPHSSKHRAFLEVKPIVICEKIPASHETPYRITQLKESFGPNAKYFLLNIGSILGEQSTLEKLLLLESLRKPNKLQWRQIDSLILKINELSGSREDITGGFSRLDIEQQLQDIQLLRELCACLPQRQDPDMGIFGAWQIAKLIQTKWTEFKAYANNAIYKSKKERVDSLLNSLIPGNSWIKFKVKKQGEQLIFTPPEVLNVSNGQHDIYTFIASLLAIEFSASKDRCIIIVDEIFDYLDECNLMLCQYYFSKFVKNARFHGRELYPIILTHLDPIIFTKNCFAFRKKNSTKVHYLHNVSNPQLSVNIAKIINNRDDETIRDTLGKYFFHFYPSEADLSTEFSDNGLSEALSKSSSLKQYSNIELEKYLKGNDSDLLAVSLAIRVMIEEKLFTILSDETERDIFLHHRTKGTLDKIEYCEELGIESPETYKILAILFNDALHHADIESTKSKMEHQSTKTLIQAAYQSTPRR